MYLHTQFKDKSIFHNVEIVLQRINRNFKNNIPLIASLINIDQWSSQDGGITVHELHKWRASDSTCQENWESEEREQTKGGRGSEHTRRLSAITTWVHLGMVWYGRIN